MAAIKGIKYISMHGTLGYFSAAKRYMLGFVNHGIPLTWTPMVPGNRRRWGFVPFRGSAVGDVDLDHFCNRAIDYDTVIIHTPPELYPFWMDREKGKRVLGYTVWETDRIPRHWPALLNTISCILVPCRWNRKVFQSCGVAASIGVVPHIVPVDMPPESRITLDISAKDFVFYAVESWRANKGIEGTIRCYLDTFNGDNSTLLLLKTSSSIYYQSFLGRLKKLRKGYRWLRQRLKVSPSLSLRPDANRLVQSLRIRYSNPARIKLVTDRISESEVAALHKRGDCYVSLCRSEGWGLGPFQAASYGKPVIMTGYGGQLDYLSQDMAYLVEYRLVTVRNDENPVNFTSDQRWAEPDLSHASRLMREVVENREQAAVRGRMLKEHVLEKFSEAEVMNHFINLISEM